MRYGIVKRKAKRCSAIQLPEAFGGGLCFLGAFTGFVAFAADFC